MRKISLLLLILILLVSCGTKTPPPQESTVVTTLPVSGESTGNPVTDPPETEPSVFAPTVILTTETESLGGVSYRTWRYPTVVAEGYAELCENINAALYNTVTALGKKLLPGINGLVASGNEVSCETERCDYRLICDRTVLTVGYYLTARVDSNTPERIFGAVNINLTTGQRMDAASLIPDLSKLIGALADGTFPRVDGGAALTQEELSSALSQYRADYAIYPDVYFAETSVLVSVSLMSAEGGYAQFGVPYDVAADYFAPSLLGN